ncbi:hypothetical protein [Siccibacter colletis]|uniref:Uncharacterized protein n=1 Tax=Siccibacter colletis TaxID=1505757 RepID=A0ABY6JIX4_9ENTR|nr:hypothetical protein [Siccibacter colletis]UYU33710.1 hypothetical protein KFZ77_09500 [Siccibacter colletis]
MNMIKSILFLFLFSFSSSLLALMDLSSIAGKLYEKLREDKLTTLQQECLSFEYDNEDADSVFFSARDNHANKACGGDENVSVKLFYMKYEKKTGFIYVEDELNPGAYQRLK